MKAVTPSMSEIRASRPPQVAVLGCGHWGRNLVRNFGELDALAAVYDPDEAAADAMVNAHGAPSRSLAEIFDDASIPAVAVAAPAAMHATLVRDALKAGKHVFVEKPLALDVTSGEELCALAETSGRILMVGHLLQYHPAFLALRGIVDGGELGRLQYLYSNRLNLGRFRQEENILWSFAPHDISMILALVGGEPDGVDAVGGMYLHAAIADVTTTHLTFSGGQRAHIFVSWLHPVKEQRLVVVGDRGMAVFDDAEPWETKLQLYRHHVEWRRGMPEPFKAHAEPVSLEIAEPLRVECEHFLSCVSTGATPRTDGREGLRVLRVLDRAEASMRPRGARKTETSSRTGDDDVFIHESAYVDEPVDIGRGTRIWHFSHVLPRTTIGRGCTIGQNVMIGPDVAVGDNCKIQNNVSLYKGVVLEDGVFCGPSCVFTNVRTPRSEVERKDEFERTLVERGATIGANATIVCGKTIGAHSMVAAGAVVTADVPPFALVAGVPARRIGWVSRAGDRLGDDLVCPRTGTRYVETASGGLEELVDD